MPGTASGERPVWLVSEGLEKINAECTHRSSDDENQWYQPSQPVVRIFAENNSDDEGENHQHKLQETPYELLARFHITGVYPTLNWLLRVSIDEKSPLQCAGLNRLEVEDERASRERSSDPLGLEFCAATARDTAKRRQRIGGVGIQLRKDAIRTPTPL